MYIYTPTTWTIVCTSLVSIYVCVCCSIKKAQPPVEDG